MCRNVLCLAFFIYSANECKKPFIQSLYSTKEMATNVNEFIHCCFFKGAANNDVPEDTISFLKFSVMCKHNPGSSLELSVA